MRGHPASHPPKGKRQRSIPACAGAPSTAGPAASSCWVYPRVCGGTALIAELIHFRSGLSPRVRGHRSRRARLVIHAASRGLSPRVRGHPVSVSNRTSEACNGKVYPRVCGGTRSILQYASLLWVYPRVCGGTTIRIGSKIAELRSIPACAGAPDGRHVIAGTAVYPRVCGGTTMCHAGLLS